ncbi:ATPase [bacterium]|nr:ATPase [bacterium]
MNESGIQRISIDVSKGYFDPTVIRATAGIPLELTFGEGSGCMAQVAFPDFDILKDLTRGGAVVELPALEPGEYGFSCGMSMVFGSLVVD